MLVPKGSKFNFAYILAQMPGKETLDPQIVVTRLLQMEWEHSAVTSETCRDVGEHLLHQKIGSLSPHPFGKHMLNTIDQESLHKLAEQVDM